MLWVLKRTTSVWWLFWAPETYVKMMMVRNYLQITLKTFVYLNLWYSVCAYVEYNEKINREDSAKPANLTSVYHIHSMIYGSYNRGSRS